MTGTKVFSQFPFDSRVFVAGHSGLVGSAIVRALGRHGFTNVVVRSRAELDLLDQLAVQRFFAREHIDFVFLVAAKVGGILYNASHQADFLYENLMISANVIKAAADFGVEKLLYTGSSCIYPKLSPQPIAEEALLSGPLEPTNEGYALAKIAGLKLCEKFHSQYGKRFVSVMPTNMYGPNDNFHPDHSHVIPGMMRRFHEAKEQGVRAVTVWGTGQPRREFLYVDDFAEAALVIMDQYEEPTTINVGTGEDVTIRHLAEQMAEVVGFRGEIVFDTSKPDGMMRKVLDVSRVQSLGWKPTVSLTEGLSRAYSWALRNGIFASASLSVEKPSLA